MRENVERAQGRADAIEFSGADRAHRSRGLQEFVAGQREEHALGHAPEPVTGAAHPLQECRKRARRADVADQVDMSDVDAEFKRSGGDDDRHIARLELPLGGETDALVEAAVVCGDLVHAEFLPESVRDAFDQAPGVHEHDCRSVHGGEFDDPVVHGIAQFMARDRAEFEVGHGLDREIHRAAVAGVDDGAVRCSAGGDRVGSDQPTRDFVERLLGRGQPDPLERPPSGPGETRPRPPFAVAQPARPGPSATSASSRSIERARCAPRLSPAIAWISSTIRVRAPASMRRLLSAVSSMYSDSGVVMSTCGGWRSIACRSLGVVSPLRTAMRIWSRPIPSVAASSRISASGCARFFSMSLPSALSGET